MLGGKGEEKFLKQGFHTRGCTPSLESDGGGKKSTYNSEPRPNRERGVLFLQLRKLILKPNGTKRGKPAEKIHGI